MLVREPASVDSDGLFAFDSARFSAEAAGVLTGETWTIQHLRGR